MKIGNRTEFINQLAIAAGATPSEIEAEITSAEARGMDPWQGLLRQDRVTLFDVMIAALMASEGGDDLPARTLAISEDDALPDFDAIIDVEIESMLAVGERNDPARRTMILCDPETKGYSDSALDRFMVLLMDSERTITGILRVPQKRIDLIRSAHRSRDVSSKSSEDVDQYRIFDEIARGGINEGASDIHITVGGGVTSIAFRVDGDLAPWRKVPLNEAQGIALLSSMHNSLAERSSVKGDFNPRIEQDAVIERAYENGLVRFRYSALPIEPGSVDITLRIIHISARARARSMVDLGYSPDQADALDRMFSKGGGMVVFAGTTGSGKSTSMANMLTKYTAEHPGKKVRTVEEPVEYRIPGAFQTSVRRLRDDASDFLRVLRQIMRADPDVIMVGEIRDNDTAALAVQAVRSGHLCISTLHANSAPVCYDRFSGMGVGRLDLASIGLVHGFVYQKLVQVLCPHCKISMADFRRAAGEGERPILQRLDNYLARHGHSDSAIAWRNPSGCDRCRRRGISGREVCAEILQPRPAILEHVASGNSNMLWREWRSLINLDAPDLMEGRTSFEHALYKMVRGIVSPLSVESEFGFLDDLDFEFVDRQLGLESHGKKD